MPARQPKKVKVVQKVRSQPQLWVSWLESLESAPERRRTTKTAELVAEAIVRDINARALKTGDTLPPEATMLEQYHVSRSSLREGLRLLEVQGLIRLKPGPGGGPVVGTVDPQNLARISTLYLNLAGASYADLRETHLITEPLAAELAARNPDRDLVRTTMQPFMEGDMPLTGDAYRASTNGFHGAINELVGNRVMELFVRVISHVVAEHVITRVNTTGIRGRIQDEHQELAAAVVAGHPTKARQLMSAHFEWLWEHYEAVWPARFDESIEWT